MDLKKEIKLSDLFRRGSKPAQEDTAVPSDEQPARERTSLLKRELSFGRRKGADDGEQVEKAAKPEKPKRERSFGRRKPADGEQVEQAEKPKREKRPRREKREKPDRGGRREKAPKALPVSPLMRAFDLMPREDEREADGRRPSTPQLVLAVVGLVLVAALASIFLISNARVADKEQEVNALKGRLAGLEQPQEKPVPQGDETLVQERDGRTSAVGTALGRRIAWDRLLRDVSLVMPEDAWLDTLKATAATPSDAVGAAAAPSDPTAGTAPSSFELTGYTRRQASVAELLSRLAVLPEIASVRLVSATTTEVGGQTVVQFNLSATLKVPTAGVTT